MERIWHTVPFDIQQRGKLWGFEVRTSGTFPAEKHELLATYEEVEEIYDRLTGEGEAYSNPYM